MIVVGVLNHRHRPCGGAAICELAEVVSDVCTQQEQIVRGRRACGVEPSPEHDAPDEIVARGSNDLEAHSLEIWRLVALPYG